MTRLGVTGHQNLPDEATDWIRHSVRASLLAIPNLKCICSLAVGADQLVATEALAAGGGIEVIIPSAHYRDLYKGQALTLYDNLLGRATSIEVLDFAQPSPEAFLAAGKTVVDRCDQLLAVWDGLPAAGPGGTGDVVHYAIEVNVPVHVIWPPGATRV